MIPANEQKMQRQFIYPHTKPCLSLNRGFFTSAFHSSSVVSLSKPRYSSFSVIDAVCYLVPFKDTPRVTGKFQGDLTIHEFASVGILLQVDEVFHVASICMKILHLKMKKLPSVEN
jgi:hypothetical protein